MDFGVDLQVVGVPVATMAAMEVAEEQVIGKWFSKEEGCLMPPGVISFLYGVSGYKVSQAFGDVFPNDLQ